MTSRRAVRNLKPMQARREGIYVFAAILSGVFWAWIVDLLGHTTETSSPVGICVYYLFGAVTALAVSYLFRPAFRARGAKFFLVPAVTLLFATQFFGLLHWFWLASYTPPLPSGFLFGVLTTFFIMTFFSLLTPIFYILALLNQSLMRYILDSDSRRP